jgi:hypothetical protein
MEINVNNLIYNYVFLSYLWSLRNSECLQL